MSQNNDASLSNQAPSFQGRQTAMRAAVFLVLALFLGGCDKSDAPAGGERQTITDLAGRQISLPRQIARVACMEVLCYEKMFLLGQSPRVLRMLRTDPPWMERTNPAVSAIVKVDGEEPNIEDLLQAKVDVVFLRYDPKRLARLEEAGIPAVVSQPPTDSRYADAKAFAATQAAEMRLFGRILGGEAGAKAEDWCAWYEGKIAALLARTAAIPAGQRLRTYYLRGPDALITGTVHSNPYWYGEIGGADMVEKNLTGPGKGLVAMEAVIGWDPQVILVGRQYSTDLVLGDERWKDISARRNGQVIPLPNGVFYWDGSTEGALFAEFVAKTLYPDRFADLDMAAEVRGYFHLFYHYEMTAEEADRFLHGQGPDGRRYNDLRN